MATTLNSDKTAIGGNMSFSKRFPRNMPGSNYPVWEEVRLTKEEEQLMEQAARNRNHGLMKECIEDAKKLCLEKGLKDYQSDIIQIAIALFNKRASHEVYWKEEKCKEKFDKK